MCSYDAQQVFGQGGNSGGGGARPVQDTQQPAARNNTPVQATGQMVKMSPLGLPNISGTDPANGFKTMLGA